MSAQVAAVLRGARDLIAEPEAWIKGEYEVNGCFCAAGAIDVVIAAGNPYVHYSSEHDLARDAMMRAAGSSYRTVTAWNDAPERTHAEVIAAFDAAIAAEDAS